MGTGTRSMSEAEYGAGRTFRVIGAPGVAGTQVIAVAAGHGRFVSSPVRGAARPASRAMVVLASAAAVMLLWTLSYVLRPPAGVMDAPDAYARYALEGMALALVWLGAILGACAAVLTGLVAVRGRD